MMLYELTGLGDEPHWRQIISDLVSDGVLRPVGVEARDPNYAICNCGTVTTGERFCDDCLKGGKNGV